MSKDNVNCIGKAFAGHASRNENNEKKSKDYDNILTDFVNLIIAESKLKLSFKKKG